VQDGPQAGTDRRAPGLPGEDRSQLVGQPTGLGRLAAALGPFDGDVDGSVHGIPPLLPGGQSASDRFAEAVFFVADRFPAAAFFFAADFLPAAFFRPLDFFLVPPFAATASRRMASSS
jgi:hypothetical protein